MFTQNLEYMLPKRLRGAKTKLVLAVFSATGLMAYSLFEDIERGRNLLGEPEAWFIGGFLILGVIFALMVPNDQAEDGGNADAGTESGSDENASHDPTAELTKALEQWECAELGGIMRFLAPVIGLLMVGGLAIHTVASGGNFIGLPASWWWIGLGGIGAFNLAMFIVVLRDQDD
jgi:hypothetical protein